MVPDGLFGKNDLEGIFWHGCRLDRKKAGCKYRHLTRDILSWPLSNTQLDRHLSFSGDQPNTSPDYQVWKWNIEHHTSEYLQQQFDDRLRIQCCPTVPNRR